MEVGVTLRLAEVGTERDFATLEVEVVRERDLFDVGFCTTRLSGRGSGPRLGLCWCAEELATRKDLDRVKLV